ncbi:sigma-70 family RNA polymerase sigma factor [Dactylosporangium siamense]|uniref:RNA polymerase sigma24 factor n=1 Tax=Dactylosporangium siamense TaxID=685454 RepID=A0A919U671_9ACTN|nr:sigma-70 family RNA polymerase sigma factor [Dactylosporangium siamense]GIG44124.1 RNA polymerase sigma24 factor [Dactylosporangium siamense]
MSDEAEFRDYAGPRMATWRRTAYLLCRDWHLADDLVATVLDKLFRQWHRREAIRSLDAYVGGMLARAVVDEHRRPWRREHLEDGDRDVGVAVGVGGGVEATVERLTLDTYLAQLGPRRRAVLVLRFYCDLSVEETAEILGVSIGTVKSQTARGLETLRALAAPPTATVRQA